MCLVGCNNCGNTVVINPSTDCAVCPQCNNVVFK